MTISDDGPELRERIALGCRILAHRGLVDGILGHVSARVSDDEIVIRCRGPEERGLLRTRSGDVRRLTLDGDAVDVPEGYAPPKELALHTEIFRARPEVHAVVHAHPRSAVLCTLGGLKPRPVFGAYDIPAMRLASQPIPVYRRAVLVSTPALAREMVEAMGESDVCLLHGHGVAVVGASVEAAVVRTIALNTILEVTVELARLRATPSVVPKADQAHLPDLGSAFNDGLSWRALVAELGEDGDGGV